MANKPAVKTVLALACGILIAHYGSLPLGAVVLSLSLIILVILIVILLRGTTLNALLYLGLCLAGALRYQIATGYQGANHISNFVTVKHPVAVEGTIIDSPEVQEERITLTVKVKRLWVTEDSLEVSGKILVRLDGKDCPVAYGDRIFVQGRLRQPRDQRNPGEFDYRKYLKAQGIYGILYGSKTVKPKVLSHDGGNWFFHNLVYPLREFIIRSINHSLPDQESAFLKGLMVRERAEISPEVEECFVKAGVFHILAVSGLHVGFVLLIFIGLFSFFRFPYAIRVMVTILALIIFACVTELKPPVVRATIMASIFLVGTLIERRGDPYNSLAVAALFILLINPLELFEVGFQLSFVAVFSIFFFMES